MLLCIKKAKSNGKIECHDVTIVNIEEGVMFLLCFRWSNRSFLMSSFLPLHNNNTKTIQWIRVSFKTKYFFKISFHKWKLHCLELFNCKYYFNPPKIFVLSLFKMTPKRGASHQSFGVFEEQTKKKLWKNVYGEVCFINYFTNSLNMTLYQWA